MSELTTNLKLLIEVFSVDGAMDSIDEMINNGAETIEDLTQHLRDELSYAADSTEEGEPNE